MKQEPVAWIAYDEFGDFMLEPTPDGDYPWQPLYTAPRELSDWIPVSKRLPEDGQTVAFVVKASKHSDYLNGMVLGGKYRGAPMFCFSVPGVGFLASHWMSLPDAPNTKESE